MLGKERLKVVLTCNFEKLVEYGNISVQNNGTQSSDCIYHSPFLAHLPIYIVSDFWWRYNLQFVPNFDTDLEVKDK